MNEVKKKSAGNIFLWWEIDPEDFNVQISQYETLSTFKAVRKISALLLLLSAVITAGFVFGKLAPPASLLDSAILLILAPFAYNGQKWALFTAMVYWTLTKAFFVFNTPTFAFVHILWWCAYMKAFFTAYVVERKKTINKAHEFINPST